jgi:alkanesulfonate monooxygenase SsuD/methylene tetrahydromethanopterin reductase-like flavin-dependent oxidoreductase (luciferase family)
LRGYDEPIRSAYVRTEVNKIGSSSNGIKLAAELLLYQLLTQFLAGFDHKREALGPPLLDARLRTMGRAGFTIKAANGILVFVAPSHRRASRKLIRSTPMCWSVADWHMTMRTRL